MSLVLYKPGVKAARVRAASKPQALQGGCRLKLGDAKPLDCGGFDTAFEPGGFDARACLPAARCFGNLMPCLLAALFLLAGLCRFATAAESATPAPRFETRELVVDSGRAGLAAWQVELTYDPAQVTIVGVEGGTAAPFGPDKPPFYDPKGLAAGRLVLANLTTDAKPASGAQTVARLHLRVTGAGAPKITAKVVAAGDATGKRLAATAEVKAKPAAEEISQKETKGTKE